MAAPITTTVSAVQDALAVLVGDAVAVIGVSCGRGQPTPDELKRGGGVRVWLPLGDPAAAHSQTFRVSSLTAKAEDFEQSVCVFAEALTGDPTVVRDKLDQAVTLILTAVSTDPTLGGLVMLTQAANITREEAAPEPNLRQMAATIRLRVDAWLVA